MEGATGSCAEMEQEEEEEALSEASIDAEELARRQEMAEALKAFQIFDHYEDGKIEVADIVHVMHLLCQYPTQDDVKHWFGRCQTATRINFEDFFALYEEFKRPQGEWYEQLAAALHSLDRTGGSALLAKDALGRLVTDYGDVLDEEECRDFLDSLPTCDKERSLCKIHDLLALLLSVNPTIPVVKTAKNPTQKRK